MEITLCWCRFRSTSDICFVDLSSYCWRKGFKIWRMDNPLCHYFCNEFN